MEEGLERGLEESAPNKGMEEGLVDKGLEEGLVDEGAEEGLKQGFEEGTIIFSKKMID